MADLIDGKYEVLALIKEGGMGAIYKVRHVFLDEVRVVKMIRPQIIDDPDAQKRFIREARMATQLKHPNIAALIDFVADKDQTYYMVMEYIDGYHLGEYVERFGRPSFQVGLDIATQTLDALGYLHRKGIVHRDISPENLMLTRDSEGKLLVKMIDLGVAKETAAEGMTITGMFVGKLKYSSPEQLGVLKKGEKIDGRSDLYSLGCVLFQMLTGAPAFYSETPQGYIRQHLMQSSRRFEDVEGGLVVPADIRDAVMKSLSRKRDDRWASAEEFAEALRAARQNIVSHGASPDLTPDEPTRPFQRETLQSAAERPTIEIDAPRRSSAVRTTAPRTSAATPAPAERTLQESGASKSRSWRGINTTLRQGGRLPLIFGGSVFVLALAVGIVVALRGRTARPTVPGTLELIVRPWGRLESLYDETAKVERVTAGSQPTTPVRLTLPPGRYRIRVIGPGAEGEPTETTFVEEVVSARGDRKIVDIQGFDIDKAVRIYVP